MHMLLVFYVTIWLDARRLAGVQVLMGVCFGATIKY